MELEKSKIIFLGTGTSQGIPVIGSQHPVCLSQNPKDKRLRTSALVEYKNLDLLIDCGTDFRTQMLRENKSNVDALLLTHEHADHTGGMDDLRPINFIRKKDIPVYALSRVLEDVKTRYSYAFQKNKYPGAPGFQLFPIEGDILIQEALIQPIYVMHGKLPVLGYKIGGLSYITDASYIEESELKKIYKTKILVINALRKDLHPTHFNLKEALNIIEMVKPQQAYLTHISYNLGFHDEVQKILPENVFLAYDGLQVYF